MGIHGSFTVEQRPDPRCPGYDADTRAGGVEILRVSNVHAALHALSLQQIVAIDQALSVVEKILASLTLARATLRADHVLLWVSRVNCPRPRPRDAPVRETLHIQVSAEEVDGIMIIVRRKLVLIGRERSSRIPFLRRFLHLLPGDVGSSGDVALHFVAGTPAILQHEKNGEMCVWCVCVCDKSGAPDDNARMVSIATNEHLGTWMAIVSGCAPCIHHHV